MVHETRRLCRLLTACLFAIAVPIAAAAQAIRGVVVDQTDLPLPGVTIQVLDAGTIAATVVTGPDGSFSIDAAARGNVLVVALDGFEPQRLSRSEASRIVLQIARAAESTTVVAPA